MVDPGAEPGGGLSGDAASCEVHGTCIDIGGAGVLLRGAPGAGKSDLALRLIEDGARLVADDRVRLRRSQGRIHAFAPAPIAGLIEVRGLGIVRLSPDAVVAESVLVLVVDLVPAAAVERLPEPAQAKLLGLSLPLASLDAFAAAAPAKLRLAAGRGPGSIMPPE